MNKNRIAETKQPFVTVVDNNYNEADFILRYKVIPPPPKVYKSIIPVAKKRSKNNSVKTSHNSTPKSSQNQTETSCQESTSEPNNSNTDSQKSNRSKRANSPRKKSNAQSPDDIYYRLNGIDDFLRF